MTECKKTTTTSMNLIILWIQIARMAHSVYSEQYVTITVEVNEASLNFSRIYTLSEANYLAYYKALCNETVINLQLTAESNYSTQVNIITSSNEKDQTLAYSCGVQISSGAFGCGRITAKQQLDPTQYFYHSNDNLCGKKCIYFYTTQKVQITTSKDWLTSSQQECGVSTSTFTSTSLRMIDFKTSPSSDISNVITSPSNTDIQHKGDNVEDNLPLIIGCSVGGAVTIIVIFIVVFVVKKKHIRTNTKHSSPSKNTFIEFLKNENTGKTVTASNFNSHHMRSGNTDITTESNDLKSNAIKNVNKSSNVLYSETYAHNSNNNNGSHNKIFNPAHDSVYSTVDPVELNKSNLRDQQVKVIRADQEPYLDVTLPDQTASLYSRLRESGKEFQNVYNVSSTQEMSRPQYNNTSSYVQMVKEDSAITTEPMPSYENVDNDAGQDVYAQVNKQGRSNKLETKTNSSNSPVF